MRHGVEVGALVRMDDDAAEGRGLLHEVVHPAPVAAGVGRFGLDLATRPTGPTANGADADAEMVEELLGDQGTMKKPSG